MKRLFRLILGDKGERAAIRYLKKRGFRILERKSRSIFGEIDIIALDGKCIVFVEVKTRTSDQRGQPFEAVNSAKQEKITRAALSWLKRKKRLNDSARFDVISILWPENSSAPEIQHFRSAFEATGRGQFFN